MFILDNVLKELRKVIQNVTIKYEREAKKYETAETRRNWDYYYLAVHKYDKFETHKTYEVDVILNSGITTSETLARMYNSDKYLIPENQRYAVLEAKRKQIIENFEEKNNYYRRLLGLPNIEDTQFIYLDEQTAYEIGSNTNTPVHLLKEEQISALEKMGYIEKLKKLYPDKKYLNYLGPNKIDLIVARESNNFSILSIKGEYDESFLNNFKRTYYFCREYFVSVIYNREFGRFDLYDNFIAMMIMVMTVQRFLIEIFKQGINDEFYDLKTLKMLFDMYSVPFIEKLPLEYQKSLARNLNNLLHYKSTDKVLYDICSILGFERANIYKYYLVKEHKTDNEGKPLFLYKEEVDENGNTILVEDKEKMYELYFQTVELKERNTALALLDSGKKEDYNQVISDDIFWWNEDEELNKIIYESEFNYVETKFLGLNIMYKMTQLVFEIIYFIRLISDKSNQTRKIYIDIPKILSNNTKVSLFEIVVFLISLICKKSGMLGNIINTPTKTLSVLGFNFRADFDKIRQDIKNNKYIDDKVLSYIMNMDVYSVQDINGLYKNVRELNDFLVEKMATTQNIEQYRAYKKLFETLYITEIVDDVFKKKDGQVAETYLEFLHDLNPLLAQIVEESDKEKASSYIDYIVNRLTTLITELRYLYAVDESNNVILEALAKLINFFKSYTTDLRPLNILYLMDSRFYNIIKLINDIKRVEKTLQFNDGKSNVFYKTFYSYNVRIPYKEIIKNFNKLVAASYLRGNEIQILKRLEPKTYSSILENSKILSYEFIKGIGKDIMYKLSNFIKPSYLIDSKINNKENIYNINKMKKTEKQMILSYVLERYSDTVMNIVSSAKIKDSYKINFLYRILINILNKEKINIKDKSKVTSKVIQENYNMENLKDNIHIESSDKLSTKVQFKDGIKLIWEE